MSTMVDCLVKKLPLFSNLQWVLFLCACASLVILSLQPLFDKHLSFSVHNRSTFIIRSILISRTILVMFLISDCISWFQISILYLFFNKVKLTSLPSNQWRVAGSEIKPQIWRPRMGKCAAWFRVCDNEYGAIVEWWLGVEKRKKQKNPLCPPQITHEITKDWTWDSTVKGQHPSFWFMAWSHSWIFHKYIIRSVNNILISVIVLGELCDGLKWSFRIFYSECYCYSVNLKNTCHKLDAGLGSDEYKNSILKPYVVI